MTPYALHAKIKDMWPNSAAARVAWAEQYVRVLKPFGGDKLAKAWDRWLESPPHDHPPKPHELARLCRPDPSARPRTGLGEQPYEPLKFPLPAGDVATFNREIDRLNRLIQSADGNLHIGLLKSLRAIGEKQLERHQRALDRQSA